MKKNVQDITLLGVMSAIIIVMFLIPGLSFIPIGQINATLGHIPVIIIAIVKGPKLGAILGGVFGFTSFINAMIRPNATSFIFMNPIVSILPRVMIGVVAGLTYLAFRKREKIGISISAAMGSIVNTIMVLGLIYLIYGNAYLSATNRVGQTAGAVLFTIGSTVGIVEMIVSVIIVTPISIALLKIYKKDRIWFY